MTTASLPAQETSLGRQGERAGHLGAASDRDRPRIALDERDRDGRRDAHSVTEPIHTPLQLVQAFPAGATTVLRGHH